MVARMRVPLSRVDSDRWKCSKPNCNTGSECFHRHHIRHEAMWLGIWAGRRAGERKFYEFVKRYHDFRYEDWRVLCDHHHAEIHQIYDQIIRLNKLKTKRSLRVYSWTQAEHLMDELEAAFMDWIRKETPGIDSHTFSLNRTTRKRPKK